MDTPQLPDMIPDAVKTAKLSEVAKHPLVWALMLIGGLLLVFVAFLLFTTREQVQQANQRAERAETAEKALTRELLIKNGIINNVQQKSDSLQSQ